jgi:uncharacterized cupredoxin-like copper-binding protein
MAGAVNVALGEMFVKADKATVKAGEVMFDVENTGATMHGLAIAKAPAPVKGGMLDETAWLAKGKDLAGGEGGDMVHANLKPGSYELVCFIAGHYAAGQRSAFTVTG